MVNWKNIDINFTEELQTEWENKGFGYEECKEWINIGLQPSEADFAYWLKEERLYETLDVLNNEYEDIESLKEQFKWEWEWWREKGLEEWIKVGLKLQDHEFVDYLQKDGYQPTDINRNNINQLRKNYSWQNIHPDFSFWGRNNWEGKGLDYQQTQEWIEIGLIPSEHDFASYLKSKGYDPSSKLKLEELKKEYSKAQEWMKLHYPLAKRKEITNLSISGFSKRLEGEIDLSDFVSLKELSCSWHKLTNLILKNNDNLEKISCSYDQLTSLDLSDCPKLTYLSCGNNQITNLNISNCTNLIKLNCWKNYITSLDLSNSLNLTELNCSENKIIELDIRSCPHLKRLSANDNLLTSTEFLKNCKQLTSLDISANNFVKQDLNCFSHLVNLYYLGIGNSSNRVTQKKRKDIRNKFYGSLEPLKNLIKLRVLDINETDIDSGLEYLPSSLKEICSPLNINLSINIKLEKQLRNYKKVKEERDDNLSYYYDFRRWWKNKNPNLVTRLQKVTDLENILENLELALDERHYIRNETIKQGINIFVFESQETIIELSNKIAELQVKSFENKIEIPPKNK